MGRDGGKEKNEGGKEGGRERERESTALHVSACECVMPVFRPRGLELADNLLDIRDFYLQMGAPFFFLITSY